LKPRGVILTIEIEARDFNDAVQRWRAWMNADRAAKPEEYMDVNFMPDCVSPLDDAVLLPRTMTEV